MRRDQSKSSCPGYSKNKYRRVTNFILRRKMKSLRNRFAVCALTLGALSGGADAAQIVFEAPVDNWNQEISADFAANRELGRAWIDLQVETTSFGEDP